MGQFIAAIVYGVKLSEDLEQGLASTREDFDPDFEDALEDLDDAFKGSRVRIEQGENHDCLGFAIAVSGGGEDGEGYIESTFSMDEVPTVFPDEYARAVERWQTLAAWVKENRSGFELPAPGFLITYTERA